MKLSESIARINKDDIESCYDVEVFNSALGMSCYTYDSSIAERLKYVFLTKWLCTDTWVGVRVYFLDDVPVAVTNQTARKNDEEVEFISASDAERMQRFLIELSQAEQPSFHVCNLDEEVGEHYTVEYGGQLLAKEGFYQGFAAKVQKTYDNYVDIGKWQVIEISYSDGVSTIFKEIDISEFMIPLNVVKD